MFVTAADGTNLHVTDHHLTDQGEPGRAVVFVHAWGLTSAMWGSQVAATAAAGFRPVTIDRRSHGRSDLAPGGYDLDTLAGDLGAVLDQLDLRNVVLVAHSMGAVEAVRAAAGPAADRVASLVLSAPTTPCLAQRPDNPTGVPAELLAAGWEALRADLGAWIAANTEGYWGVGVEARPVDTTWTQQTLMSTPLPVLLATNRMMIDADVRADCAAFDGPALVIHGDADRSAPLPLTGAPTADLLPRGRLVVVEGAGHGLYTSYAEVYNHHLLEFLAS